MAIFMAAALDLLPVGFRFHPTDEELLDHYLIRKHCGAEEAVCAISKVDLCRWVPEELPKKFNESSIVQSKDPQWWFFCEKKPGPTQQRSTKGGFWKKTGRTTDVNSRYGRKQLIGYKNYFTFFRGTSKNSTKTDWVMHEFQLTSNALNGLPEFNGKNYALCMIKCYLYENTKSNPAYECELDEPVTIDTISLLEPEADDGSIPEVTRSIF